MESFLTRGNLYFENHKPTQSLKNFIGSGTTGRAIGLRIAARMQRMAGEGERACACENTREGASASAQKRQEKRLKMAQR